MWGMREVSEMLRGGGGEGYKFEQLNVLVTTGTR